MQDSCIPQIELETWPWVVQEDTDPLASASRSLLCDLAQLPRNHSVSEQWPLLGIVTFEMDHRTGRRFAPPAEAFQGRGFDNLQGGILGESRQRC